MLANSDMTTRDTPAWRAGAGAWALILVVPGLVISQWAALQVAPRARLAFNALLLAAVLIVLIASRRVLALHRPMLGAGLTVIAFVAFSLLANRVFAPRIAVFGSLPYIFPVTAAAAAVIWKAPETAIRVALRVATVVMGLLAVAAVIQLAFGETGFRITGQSLKYPRWWERGRATGLVVNPGRLAHIGLAGVALAPLAGRWRRPLTAAGAVAAAASGGRVVLISAVALALTALAARKWSGSRSLLIGAVAVVVLFAVVLLAVPAARDDFLGRVETTVDDAAIDVRVENIRASGDLIRDKPLLGAGPGRFGSTTAFAAKSELHDEYGLLDVRSPEFVEKLRERGDLREIDVGVAQLDVGFLQVAAETGILGLIATAVFACLAAVRAVRGRSLTALSLLVLLAIYTATGPGWVDISITGAMLWWTGATIDQAQR